MKTLLSSPIKDAANNIVLKPKALRTKKDYENFIKWLDTSNRDLKKIKIPDKRKIEKLELKFGDGFFDEGDSEGSPLIPLIGGGLGGLVFGGGKKLLGKMFPRAAEKGAEKAAVPAAESVLQKGVSKAAPVAEDAAKIAALRGGEEVAAKGGGLAAKLIPGLATAVNLGISGYRFSKGDIVGGSLSALSAVPVFGWAAVGIDVAREFGAFEGTPFGLKKEKPKSKIEARLKEQEKKQREEASKSRVTFAEITDKFDKIVSKFEKVTFGITGVEGEPSKTEEDENIEQLRQSATSTENLVGSNPISASGYEFTKQSSFSQYLTGDPNSPAYAADHGGGNYHEHLSFKDHDTALKAYDFLKSKGIYVWERSEEHTSELQSTPISRMPSSA